MAKESRKYLLLVIGIAIFSLGIFCWQYLAKARFQKLSTDWNETSAQFITYKSNILDDSGNPLSEVSYNDLSRLLNTFESNKVDLGDIQKMMATGDGMIPWLPAQRARTAASMQEMMNHEGEFIAQAQEAIQAVSDLQKQSSNVITLSANARSSAVDALNSNNDVDGYQVHISELWEISQEFPPVAGAVIKSQTASHLAGMAESLRAGMIRKMASDLRIEAGLHTNRLARTRKAQDLLVQYKNRVGYMLLANTGIVVAVESMANYLQPAIDNAFQASRPVRDLLNEANKPLLGGESSLSWASRLDPNVGVTASIFEGLCSGIELARSEISDIIQTTRPLVDSLTAFRSTRSRDSIKEVVKTSQNAASYFSSKTSIFDPVISKINEAERKVNEIYIAATRLRIPMAAGIINRLAEGANFLVNSARSPFEQGRQTIGNIANSLRDFSTQEDAYIATLRSLAQESPEVISPEMAGEQDNSNTTGLDAEPRIKKEVFRAKNIAPSYRLRSIPQDMSNNESFLRMFESADFYEPSYGPAGRGLNNYYELVEINGDKVVADYATGLMWHQSGGKEIPRNGVTNWIQDINRIGYAGFSDWRMPTLEELLSLVERDYVEREGDGWQLYTDKLFDLTLQIIATSDFAPDNELFVIDFASPLITSSAVTSGVDIRPVRSII